MKKIITSFAVAAIAFTASATVPRMGNSTSLSEDYQRITLTPTIEQPAPLTSLLKETGRPVIAAPSRAAEQVITEPTGRRRNYWVQPKYSYYMIGDYLYGWGFDKLATHMVYDKEDVYIYDPVTQLELGTYAKGRFDDDKITLELPQVLLTEELDGQVYNYYLTLLEQEETPYGIWYYPIEDVTSVEFALVDGAWVAQTDGPTILGLVNEDGDWTGFGDYVTTYYEFNYTPLELPETAVIEDEPWALISRGVGRDLTVAFDGNDIYIQNIAWPLVPDAWFKGTIEGDKAVFPSNQFLGQGVTNPTFVFLMAAKTDSVYYEEWDFWSEASVFIDEVTMNYNAEKKSLTSDGESYFLINEGNERPLFFAMFDDIEITYQPAEISHQPANPSVTGYAPFMPDQGYALVWLNVPLVNVDGYLLDSENLYYNFYVDGELFTFYPDEYPEISVEMVDVPWDFSEYGCISAYNTSRTVYLYQEGMESFGVQSFYMDGSEVHYSDLYTFDVSGVKDIDMEGKVAVAEKFYDATGKEIASPSKGFYIKSTLYNDGSVVNTKCVKR